MTKVCRCCGVAKKPGEFYRDRGMVDGRRSECRVCASAATKQRYLAHHAERLARQRDYDQSPERKLARKLGVP